MEDAITLSLEDVRHLGGGFIWYCFQSESIKTKPVISEANHQALLEFSTCIGKVNHPDFFKHAELTREALYLNGVRALSGNQNIQAMLDCLKRYFVELKTSPLEIEALSGAPFEWLPKLIDRLKALA